MDEVKEITCPVLAIFNGKTRYDNNPKKKLAILKNIIKNCETKLFENSDHWFDGNENQLGKTIAEWVEKI